MGSIGRKLYRYGLMALILAIFAAFLIWPILLTVRGGFIQPEGAVYGEGYILFDYQGPKSFKYVALEAETREWVLGVYDGKKWKRIEASRGNATVDREHAVQLNIKGGEVTLIVDEQERFTHTFAEPVGGAFGIGAKDGPTRFGRFAVFYRKEGDSKTYGLADEFDGEKAEDFEPVGMPWKLDAGHYIPTIKRGGEAYARFNLPEDAQGPYTVHATVQAYYLSAFTWKYLLGIFQDPTYMAGLRNSLLIAVCTTVLCLILAMPLAVLAARYDFFGKPILTALLLVPLILPPFVGAIGLHAILGRFGALNTLLTDVGFFSLLNAIGLDRFFIWLGLMHPDVPGFDLLGGGLQFVGVVIMEALHLYPITYLNTSAALANIDPALDEAGQNMGAGRFRRFWRITFPLILPGVFAGSTIVFIWSFTELGTPLMFSYREVTPVQVFEGINEIGTNPRPYALVVVMLAAAILLYLAGRFAFGGRAYEMQSKASIASSTKRLGLFGSLGAAGLFVFITGLAVLPHLGVILSSFTVDGGWYRSVLPQEWTTVHYENALSHPLAMGSIRNSLLFATAAMILCIVIGLSVSYLVVRAKVRGGWLLDSLAMLPLAVPGLVMAFGYVAMTLNWPFSPMSPSLRSSLAWLPMPEAFFDGPLSFISVVGQNPSPVLLLIVAYGVRRLPYVVRSVSAGLEQTSGMLEEAALNLGASTFTAIRKIIVPLIMANIIAGGILAFSFAMLEVSDSLILAQKQEHYPITKAIFEFFNRLGDGPYIASAMGVWGMALLTVTLVGASVLMGKRLGAIFRV